MSVISKDLKIEIRPIPNRKGIREFSENLEYFSQAHIISPLVDPVTLKFKTGLSTEDVAKLKKDKFPYNIDENYYRGKPHEFWESSIVKVELVNTPIFLYPGKNPIDFIKYKYILESKFVYSSEQELMEGGKTEATHYIYNEEKEIAIKANKITEKNKLLKTVEGLSKQKRKDLLLILLNEDTDNKDEDYLTVRFEDILNNKSQTEELVSILNNKQDDISIIADVKKAIQKNVLKRTKSGIFYFDNNIGFTTEDVVALLQKEENQELLIDIREKIK